jgi:hypothetical protein
MAPVARDARPSDRRVLRLRVTGCARSLEGCTLSDLILSKLPRLADKPSPEQVISRTWSRSSSGGPPASELIVAERDWH